jgi:hypothetical protein
MAEKLIVGVQFAGVAVIAGPTAVASAAAVGTGAVKAGIHGVEKLTGDE